MTEHSMQIKTDNKPDNKDDSITKVHVFESYTNKYISGQRDPTTIRIDSGLYKRFKPLAQHVYGSVCKAVETYITAFIETIERGQTKVHFSNTMSKPVNIGKIVIERNLSRERRNLVVDEEEPGECEACGRVDSRLAFCRFESGKRLWVCAKCFENYKEREMVVKVLKSASGE